MPEVGVWACYGKSVPRQGVIDRTAPRMPTSRLCHGLRTERRRCLPLVQRSTQFLDKLAKMTVIGALECQKTSGRAEELLTNGWRWLSRTLVQEDKCHRGHQ